MLCCSAFFMVNGVFIIIVLVLQLQKDCLHIEWPLGPLVNQTRVQCGGGPLDPEGEEWNLWDLFLLFSFFFLQCSFHRFGTITHIIASTELCFSQHPYDKLTEDELVAHNAIEIAKELQAFRGLDITTINDQLNHFIQPNPQIFNQQIKIFNNLNNQQPSTSSNFPIFSINSNKNQKINDKNNKKLDTLDAAFKKRFFALSSNNQQILKNKSIGRNFRKRELKTIETQGNQQFYSQNKINNNIPSPSDSEEENGGEIKNKKYYHQKAEGPVRCHQLEELFRKNSNNSFDYF
ncbi:hypothetical protein Mgra_00004281 [Meloidogyne graminicola]|uniref:Uncharacterized protein n=1 Tax=Meloidogyne graminicola TaxID=189291 RepID=A0A8S9ZST5_9BILA|nr:hypothetical protein Mgra_00004281 [Meloidogyne graminicola]